MRKFASGNKVWIIQSPWPKVTKVFKIWVNLEQFIFFASQLTNIKSWIISAKQGMGMHPHLNTVHKQYQWRIQDCSCHSSMDETITPFLVSFQPCSCNLVRNSPLYVLPDSPYDLFSILQVNARQSESAETRSFYVGKTRTEINREWCNCFELSFHS